MKFYDFVAKLQKEYDGKVILIKNGTFYNAIGKDAIIVENIFKLKRVCFAKSICKCGFPVYYYQQKLDIFEEKLKKAGISIIIFDEKENGRYIYKNKKYDILFEVKGRDIKERRENLDCLQCNNNIYYKETNQYTILKEEADIREEKVRSMLNKVKKYIVKNK